MIDLEGERTKEQVWVGAVDVWHFKVDIGSGIGLDLAESGNWTLKSTSGGSGGVPQRRSFGGGFLMIGDGRFEKGNFDTLGEDCTFAYREMRIRVMV